MSDTNDINTGHIYHSMAMFSGYQPRARIADDGVLHIYPSNNLYLSMSVSQWRGLAAVVEQAISDASRAKLSAGAL